MKDLVPLGNGNSRFLKSSISSDITFTQMVEMLRNGTFPIDFNGINPSGIAQDGTPINKSTMLTDETEKAIWGDAQDRTVDVALFALRENLELKSYEKLMETTTESDAAQIELDLSTIDMTKYAALKIVAYGTYNPTTTSNYRPALTINNNSSNIYYSTNSDSAAYDRANVQLAAWTRYGGGFSIEIFPGYNGVGIFSAYAGNSSKNDSGVVGAYHGLAKITFDEITSIQFLNENGGSDSPYAAGFHITLWGVKA